MAKKNKKYTVETFIGDELYSSVVKYEPNVNKRKGLAHIDIIPSTPLRAILQSSHFRLSMVSSIEPMEKAIKLVISGHIKGFKECIGSVVKHKTNYIYDKVVVENPLLTHPLLNIKAKDVDSIDIDDLPIPSKTSVVVPIKPIPKYKSKEEEVVEDNNNNNGGEREEEEGGKGPAPSGEE